MTTVETGFEDAAREAVLDDVERTVRTELGPALKQTVRENIEGYADRHGYDIEHIWEDAELMIDRSDRAVDIRIEYPGLTALFEFGVSPHTIEGNPLLSFDWEAPPEGTRPPGAPRHVVTGFVDWGSVTGGIPEARGIRDALQWFRREVEP